MQFHLIVVSIFLKTCVKRSRRQLQPIARKKKAKVSQFFLVECLCYATGYKLLYSSRIRIWYLPGRPTTEQIYKFPVCANVGVLFSLDILLQACEKRIETRFSLQQFRFWSIKQPCHVSVHRSSIKSLYFLILTIYFSYFDQVLLPTAVVPFIYCN